MSPERFRACLDAVCWSEGECARRLGIDARSVRRMSSGRRPVTPEVEAWLERLAAEYEDARIVGSREAFAQANRLAELPPEGWRAPEPVGCLDPEDFWP